MKGECFCAEGENCCADVPLAAGKDSCGASAPPSSAERRRFRIACRMLRNSSAFDRMLLPQQRRGESPIDWLTRQGLAPSPQVAAEMLILGAGLQSLLDELCQITRK